MKQIVKKIRYSKISLVIYNHNAIMYQLDNKNIDWFYSLAKVNNELLDTRNLKIKNISKQIKNNICFIDIEYQKDDITLIQHFKIEKDQNYFETYLTLRSNKNIKSNYLVPLNFAYPSEDSNELFLSLDERMLLVPYDNDMWVYYETTPLKPGRTSYDLSAIYNEKNQNGLVIGALDFDFWKNGIKCSSLDARCFMAISGIADEATHDHLEHAYITGKEIKSSRFICGYFEDIKNGLEIYGNLAKNNQGIYHWNYGVPFGWNSYSALTLKTNINHMNKAADFIDELKYFKNDVTYINFDAVMDIDQKDIKKLIDKLHKRNQKVGWYMNPLSHLKEQDNIPLRGNKKMKRKDILMKNNDGSLFPTIDSKYPIDITIPEANLDFRLALREFVDMGFDYLKIDFLSHGAVEGKRYDKKIRSGREALNYFYQIVLEELDPKKIGREVFISSSIDPLFPCGFSHSRRSSCDAFGHIEDVKYVLNALTYSWWTNNSLYQFNDPDHTVLYQSLVDMRSATNENEALSRYNASAISGSVMLLSDNYGPGNKKDIENAKKRALKYANNKAINELIKLNKAFKPLKVEMDNNIFYLDDYVAIFNFEKEKRKYEINPKELNLNHKGILIDIRKNKKKSYQDKIIVELDGYESIILKVK